jgi:hypothetical protein
MSDSELAQLCSILRERPELTERLKHAADVAAIADGMAAVAVECGISADQQRLSTEIRRRLNAAKASGELSDAQLARVVGGLNTSAIGMTASLYEEMWAQDVAAMVGFYSGDGT